jgi:hypothetical protein
MRTVAAAVGGCRRDTARGASEVAGVAGTSASLYQGLLAAFEHTPALALVVAAAVLVLPLAIVGALVRRLTAFRIPAADVDNTAHAAVAADRTGFARPSRVWLELQEGETVRRYALTSEVTRIGREADNDIRLRGDGIHRYHAAITRTADLDHYAVSLSGDGAHDMQINGEGMQRRRLRDGDVIGIGGDTLTFRAAPIS